MNKFFIIFIFSFAFGMEEEIIPAYTLRPPTTRMARVSSAPELKVPAPVVINLGTVHNQSSENTPHAQPIINEESNSMSGKTKVKLAIVSVFGTLLTTTMTIAITLLTKKCD